MHLRILHYLCVTESKDDLAAPKQGVVLCWSCLLCERLRFREREPTDTEGIQRQSASVDILMDLYFYWNLESAKREQLEGVLCTVLRVLQYIVPVPPIHQTNIYTSTTLAINKSVCPSYTAPSGQRQLRKCLEPSLPLEMVEGTEEKDLHPLEHGMLRRVHCGRLLT